MVALTLSVRRKSEVCLACPMRVYLPAMIIKLIVTMGSHRGYGC
jgi:hypothetical protein